MNHCLPVCHHSHFDDVVLCIRLAQQPCSSRHGCRIPHEVWKKQKMVHLCIAILSRAVSNGCRYTMIDIACMGWKMYGFTCICKLGPALETSLSAWQSLKDERSSTRCALICEMALNLSFTRVIPFFFSASLLLYCSTNNFDFQMLYTFESVERASD